ncbi:hypothetical protein J7F03_26655 [Streptomyces sp. ISL-43]|uniref:hypothetical protein n=1 Tax=Streptomyces sp. ISL-43 TaxID=2819183 RepID=UPI001BE532C6|nr:hypothetical protein [Streptomyces sp. ISL-43]MBT2450592.1 hypothetical protein [Streptomyces sp. ISL-43]
MIALKVWAASASRLPGKDALASPAPVIAWAGAFGAAMLVSGGAGLVTDGGETRAGLGD